MSLSSILNFRYLARFSIRSILALILVSLAIHMVLWCLQSEDKVTEKLSLFNKEKEELTALALGSSHSIGFHFPSLGLKGVNFHDAGGDIEEVVLKSGIIMEQAVNIRTIFIPVSPGSLYISQNYSDHFHRQLVVVRNLPLSFYTLLSTPSLILPSWVDFLFPFFEIRKAVTLMWSLNQGLNGFLSKNYGACFIPVLGDIDQDELILGVYNLKTLKAHCLDNHARITVKSHASQIESVLSNEADMPQLNVERLLTLAESLVEINGLLVVVVPPLTAEYYQDDRIQKWIPEHQKLLDLLAEHSNIDVYDFHDFFYGEMEDGSNDYFYDDDHLALPGAIKFSKALKKAMDEREGR